MQPNPSMRPKLHGVVCSSVGPSLLNYLLLLTVAQSRRKIVRDEIHPAIRFSFLNSLTQCICLVRMS